MKGDLIPADEIEWVSFSTFTSLVIQMGELDTLNGAALSALVKWIKFQLASGCTFQLIEPPQVLIHNLYRINAWPHAGLMVVNMRQDEAYG